VVPRGAVERHFPQDHAKYRATEQLRGSRWRRSCYSVNRDHAGRCSASAPTGDASVRLSIFSDAKRATAGSMPEITYGLRITKVRCRTPRKIRRSSATGSSARRRGAFVRCGRCDGCSRRSPHTQGALSTRHSTNELVGLARFAEANPEEVTSYAGGRSSNLSKIRTSPTAT
jgi:hypothetical protein